MSSDRATRAETINRLLEEVDLWIASLDEDQYDGIRQLSELEARIDRAAAAIEECAKQADTVRDYLDEQISHTQHLAEAVSSLGYHAAGPDDDDSEQEQPAA